MRMGLLLTIILLIHTLNTTSNISIVEEKSVNDILLYHCNEGNIITVNQSGSGDYILIQDAINNSNPFDTIFIQNGIYDENIVIDKPLIVKGETINSILRGIDGNCTILINSSDVLIDRIHFIFSIPNKWNEDIFADGFSNITISNCHFNMTYRPLYFASGKNLDIINCEFNGNDDDCIIEIHEFENINFENNLFRDNTYSYTIIGFDRSKNIYIKNNTFNYIKGNLIGLNEVEDSVILGNNFYGLTTYEEAVSIALSTNIVIKENLFKKILGLRTVHCDNISIIKNTFMDTWIFGIKVEEDNHHFLIDDNNFYRTDYFGEHKSIFIHNSDNITIINNDLKYYKSVEISNTKKLIVYNNTFIENNIGLYLMNCSNIEIWHNSFINNSIQGLDDKNHNWNKEYPFGGNYWDDYNRSDVKNGVNQNIDGSDGFGDQPYRISVPNAWDQYPIFKDIIPPVADAGVWMRINLGDVYHFNASGSTDDQLVHRVEWEFYYDGELFKYYQMVFDFQFNIPGHFNVNLTVYDFAGNSDKDRILITVTDYTAPIAISQGNIILNQGEVAYFNGTASTDNDMIVNFTWTIELSLDFIAELYGPTPTYMFKDPANYQVTLKVRDRSSNYGYDMFRVEVIDITPPVADAGDDMIVNSGEEVYFDGFESSDNLGNSGIWKYNWSFTYDHEIIYLEGAFTSFIFYTPGNYNVSLEVTDFYNNSGLDYVLITVIDIINPSVRINGSLIVPEGEILRLHGLNSYDNGRIVRFVWTVYDKKTIIIEGPYLNYSFIRKGICVVNLHVYDQANNSGSDTVIIQVLDLTPPIANAGKNITIYENDRITLIGSNSTDNGDIVKWIWSFEYNGKMNYLEGEMVNFTFRIPGYYQITLTVYDQSDNYGNDTITIIVKEKINEMDEGSNEKEFPFMIIIPFGILILGIILLASYIIIKKERSTYEE